VPDCADEEEQHELVEAFLALDVKVFDWIIGGINYRRWHEGAADNEDKRRQKYLFDRHHPYLPVIKNPPHQVSNNTQLMILSELGWRNRTSNGSWAKPETIQQATGTSKYQREEAVEHLRNKRLVNWQRRQEDFDRWVVLLIFNKKMPHYRVERWLAQRYEVDPTPKIGWGVCLDLAWIQRLDNRLFWNQTRFEAKGADIASRMPLAVSERTGRRILAALCEESYGVEGDEPLIIHEKLNRYQINRDISWFHHYLPADHRRKGALRII
jgi:hypothetical protein